MMIKVVYFFCFVSKKQRKRDSPWLEDQFDILKAQSLSFSFQEQYENEKGNENNGYDRVSLLSELAS